MDWDAAIDHHRQALLRIVASLFAMIGLGKGGGGVDRLSRPLYRAVLRLLRPAEAAVRRLVVVAARNIVIKPSRPRNRSSARKPSAECKRASKRSGRPPFQLFDPRKRFGGSTRRPTGPKLEPRIRFIDVGFDPTWRPWGRSASIHAAPPPAEKDTTVSATSLCRRLLAIKAALDDLPYQAKRYARWRAKPFEQRRPKLTSPLRPSYPPGYRKRPSHEVHAILTECHWLASTVPQPDTS